MKTKILFLLLFISTVGFAQSDKKEASTGLKDDSAKKIELKYNWTKEKDGVQYLKVKFKNKAKVPVESFVEFGFYINGILKERGVIANCLDKGCFKNLFRAYHLIQPETITEEEFNNEEIVIEILEFKAEETDECREADRK